MSSESLELNVQRLLESLTLSEKIKLLSGKDSAASSDISSKGIPSLRMCDGPQGPRGAVLWCGNGANAYPCGVGLAASFDRDLAARIGKQYVREAIAKNVHVLLGPTVNIARSPLSGRGFEGFGEDPFLAGELASQIIHAVQKGGVGICVKHFVANEQEFERKSSNSVVSDRALREIYLEPFRILIKSANPWALMTAYNKLNGVHCPENKWLLDTLLRAEWQYDGCVISDWTGVYDAVGGIVAGLDLEMPGPPVFRTQPAVTNLMTAGKISETDIDARVRKLLKLIERTRAGGIPYGTSEESYIDDSISRDLLAESAGHAVVLLKNSAGLLPIPPTVRKIAVVGACAMIPLMAGGGAAGCPFPVYSITPLNAIVDEVQKNNGSVTFAPGALTHKSLPVLDHYMRQPDTQAQCRAKVELWKESPSDGWKDDSPVIDMSHPPDYVMDTMTTKCFLHQAIPSDIAKDAHFQQVSLIFTPPCSGDWQIGLQSGDHGKVFIDGTLVIDNSSGLEGGGFYFGYCYAERTTILSNLQAGRGYHLVYRSWASPRSTAFPIPMAAGFQLGAAPHISVADAIAQAKHVAAHADMTIVVVGLGPDYEGEDFDRESMSLPGASDEMVDALADAVSNLVVVTQSGMAVTIPWVDKVTTLVHQFYAGAAVGQGLSDVLFGKVNPSSKLPISFAKRYSDYPCSLGFGKAAAFKSRADYQEDIWVGHRHFDRSGTEPQFPFGHGLSYTKFEYSDLQATLRQSTDDVECSVKFKLKNTGTRTGCEVSQLYVRDVQSTAPRPLRELKGFEKVLLEPGETKEVVLVLDRNAFKFWDDLLRSAWVIEPGEFELYVGRSSADLPLVTSVEVKDLLVWTGL